MDQIGKPRQSIDHDETKLISSTGVDAESKERKRLFESARLPHTLPALVFLGIDDRPTASKDSVPAQVDPKDPQGVPYFAIDAGKEDWVIEGAEFGDARASASSMSGWEAGIFAQARALIDWNCRNLVGALSIGGVVLMVVLRCLRIPYILAMGRMEEELYDCNREPRGEGALLLNKRATQLCLSPNGPRKLYHCSSTVNGVLTIR